MQAEQSLLDRIQRRQPKWYGHFLRTEDSRWPKKIYRRVGEEADRHNHGRTKRNQVETRKKIWRKIDSLAFGNG